MSPNISIHQFRSLMYKTFLTLLLIISCSAAKAQVRYTYDLNGNRVQSVSIGSLRPIRPGPKDTSKNNDSIAKSIIAEHGISVYPNPTNYQVNVNITKLSSGQVAYVYLLDVNGNTLYAHEATSLPYPIDIESYASGTYFIKVLIGKEQLFCRVLKN